MAGRMERPVIALNHDVYQDFEAGTPAQGRISMAYMEGVLEAGGLPLLVPATDAAAILRWYLERADGVLLIGGRDYPAAWYRRPPHPELKLLHPRRAACDRALIRLALPTRLPILGVCGGHQLIAIARGGALIQHIASADRHTRNQRHRAVVTGAGLMARLFPSNRLTINSSHHQAIDPRAVGRGLRVTVESDDGVIEAVEGAGERFLVGVQWHPERMPAAHRRKVFGAFIAAARAARRPPGHGCPYATARSESSPHPAGLHRG